MSEYVNPKEVFLDDIDGLRIENPEGYEGPMVSYTRTDTIPSEIDQAWEFFNWIKKICDHIGNSPDFEDDMSHEKKVALAMGIAVKVLKDLEDEEITKKEAGL